MLQHRGVVCGDVGKHGEARRVIAGDATRLDEADGRARNDVNEIGAVAAGGVAVCMNMMLGFLRAASP